MLKSLKLYSGPLLAILIFVITKFNLHWTLPMSATMAMFAWMAAWWLTEAVSIYFTSLLPLLILPIFGVMPMDKVAPLYMSEIIFLFIGGFLLAFAMEKSGLHHRIALVILKVAPKSGLGVLIGVMTSSFIVSMFINNTATTAMLLPAVLGLYDELKNNGSSKKVVAPLLLGLAFSASIGGMATTIGTAPNLIFLKAYHEHIHDAPIGFANWLLFGLPMAALIQTAAVIILWMLFRRTLSEIKITSKFIHDEHKKLGKPSRDEKVIFSMVILLMLGWMFKDNIDFGFAQLKGWSNLLPQPEAIKESTLIMLVCVLLYFVPSSTDKKNLLDWSDFKRVPIGVIFLFGGGFALSKGIEESGLSDWFTSKLEVFSYMPSFLFLFFTVLVIAFLSEFASNTAAMNIVMAIIFNVLPMVDLEAQQVLIACAMAASIGYALPAATPPNSIVYGTEMIKTKDMIKAGAYLDLAAILIVTFFCYFVVGYLF